MVKGKRTSGPALRRDLRAIIKVLYQKKALLTLEEANALLTTIPTVKELDERDRDDAEIIALFTPSVSVIQPVASHQDNDVAASQPSDAVHSEERLSPVASEQELPPPPAEVLTPSETSHTTTRLTKQPIWRRGGYLLVALCILLVGVVSIPFISARHTETCSAHSNGVILYTQTQYQGQCHAFGLGDYELASFGMAQQVSSIKDPNHAYHITLFDKAKNFYYIDSDTPIITAEWDKRAETIHVEKHRPTTCYPGTDGIIAFLNTDYSGGCLFITQNIPDLTSLNFESVMASIQFVGSYQNTRQLVIYRGSNYTERCGAYLQNQSDLLQCARLAVSVRVLPFTPPTPIPMVHGAPFAGNVAPRASLSPDHAQAVVDENLQTEWVGGHMAELDLHWPSPVTIHRVVVWDRKQSPTENNQINKLKLVFSDGTTTGSIDMISQGPRCADVTFPEKTVNWLHIIPVDASGNNGLREVEVWAPTGPQYSNNTCVNKVIVAQTIPL
jgi:hypothetical protein